MTPPQPSSPPSSNWIFWIWLAGILGLATVLGASWLSLPPSNQELLANYAKAEDFWNGWQSVGGMPWWTPNFLGGTSLAFAWTQIFTHVLMGLSGWLGGIFAGPKIIALLCWVLAAFTAFGFVRRFTGDALTAAVASFLFFFSSSFLARLSHVEHFIVVASLAFLPLAFWALLEFIRDPNRRTTTAAALALSLLALTYSKTAIMASPILGGFALYEMLRLPHYQRPNWRQWFTLAGLCSLLTVLPALPALRESRFVTFFKFSPFNGWQQNFSSKTTLSWFDRDSVLSYGMGPTFDPTTTNAGTYLGIVSLLIFITFLYLLPRGRFAANRLADCRAFISLALLAFWLSFGPKGVLLGQLFFLDAANGALDFTAALSWLLLALPPLIIFRLIPPDLPGRLWLGWALSLVYLVVPGFRLLELLPPFHDIRAPFDFFQVTGLFVTAVAAALCLRELLTLVRPAFIPIALAGVTVVQIVDVWPYTKPLRQSTVSNQVFADFLAAEQFLRESPHHGLVYPISGRYFYLLTPMLSGRGLAIEAFNSYLQQHRLTTLTHPGTFTWETQTGFWRALGVNWVLIDKSDPDSPVEFQKQLREFWPTVFENLNFAILSPESPVGGPYLATTAMALKSSKSQDIAMALQLAAHSILSIPGIKDMPSTDNDRFIPVQFESSDAGYATWQFPPTGQAGWVVLPQAWHPDWRVEQAGQWSEPIKVLNGILGTWTDGQQPIRFAFQPPSWYPWAILIAGLGWLLTIAAWLLPVGVRPAISPPAPIFPPFNAAGRVLVIIPTYREAETIDDALNETLAADPRLDVLVVDDNSPDETAARVQAHPEFSQRVHLLSRAGKQGLGSAYREGFQWGLARHYGALVEMDADLSHNPRDIPRLLAALEAGAAVAIGSRYLDGIRVDNWSTNRLMLSKWASLYTRVLTGMPLTDATSGFKAIRRECFDSFDWSTLRAEGYGFQVELHHQFWRMGLPLQEVPITFTERRAGETKMTTSIATEAARRVLQLSFSRG